MNPYVIGFVIFLVVVVVIYLMMDKKDTAIQVTPSSTPAIIPAQVAATTPIEVKPSVSSPTAPDTPVVVVPPAPLVAKFYEHCNYEGKVVELGVGDYDFQKIIDAGIVNDSISSVKVPNGLKVTLYEHAGFAGRSFVLMADATCLVDNNFNDMASSIKVERV